MTPDEFRAHKYLPAQWRKELETNGILRLVLGVMEDAHPANFSIKGDKMEDISPTRAAVELGLTRGYSKYAAILKLLATPKVILPDPGPSTYDKPPQPTP